LLEPWRQANYDGKPDRASARRGDLAAPKQRGLAAIPQIFRETVWCAART
jgi:hypothetical protein